MSVPNLSNDEGVAAVVNGLPPVRHVRVETLLAAVALALLAVVVRLPGIGDPPIEFHPTRQYRSLILARSFALERDDLSHTAVAAREAARRIPTLEPPLVELVTAAAYRAAGREHLWIGRAVSVVTWVAASFFVLALGRRFGGEIGGLSAMAVFLFNPFAVVASRSFQPDPTAVALVVLALWRVWNSVDPSARAGLVVAGVAAGAAALVKPTTLLFTIIPVLALVLDSKSTSGRRRLSTASVFIVPAVAIPMAYYAPSLLFGDALANQAAGSFNLQTLVTATFWRGWVALLERLPGFVTLITGLVGLVVSPAGRIRRFLAALWLGYPILGFLFNYHIHTHDYYGLPVLVAASLSMSVVAGRIALVARRVWKDRTGALLLAGILALAVLLAAGSVIARVTAIGDLAIVSAWREAGRVVSHSSRTVFLARWYGKPLQYHGELAGVRWPSKKELDLAAQAGSQRDESESLLLQRIAEGAEYFIVTDRVEFERQQGLLRLLTRFPLMAAGPELLVFSLKTPQPAGATPYPP
jgi:hypothetical protein